MFLSWPPRHTEQVVGKAQSSKPSEGQSLPSDPGALRDDTMIGEREQRWIEAGLLENMAQIRAQERSDVRGAVGVLERH